jgi:hypothetical protein
LYPGSIIRDVADATRANLVWSQEKQLRVLVYRGSRFCAPFDEHG